MQAVYELGKPGVPSLPGDMVLLVKPHAVVEIGAGLVAGGVLDMGGVIGAGEVFLAEWCGQLQCTRTSAAAPPRYAMQRPMHQRYDAALGDPVVGTVSHAQPSGYYVNIMASQDAYLSAIDFDGATKSSKPRLKPGDVVYATVAHHGKTEDIEVTCKAPAGMVAKDWTSGEAVFGPLERGVTVTMPIPFCRELIGPESSVLTMLGARVPFDVCVGVNGVIWVRGHGAGGAAGEVDDVEVERTAAIAACLSGMLYESEEEIQARIAQCFPDTP